LGCILIQGHAKTYQADVSACRMSWGQVEVSQASKEPCLRSSTRKQ
jgi:hypothetical protein